MKSKQIKLSPIKPHAWNSPKTTSKSVQSMNGSARCHLGANQHLSRGDTLPLPPRHASEVGVAHHRVHTVLNTQQADDDLRLHTSAADFLQQGLKLLLVILVLSSQAGKSLEEHSPEVWSFVDGDGIQRLVASLRGALEAHHG